MTAPARAPQSDDLLAVAEIASRSTTLDERIRMSAARPAVPGSTAGTDRSGADLLEAWRLAHSKGSVDQFGRRLAWDGLDPVELVPALSAPAPCPESLPPWLRLLSHAYGWGEARASVPPRDGGPAPPSPPRTVVDGESVPFEDLLLPLVELGRLELERRAGDAHRGLTSTAHAAFERALLDQLAKLCSQSLYAAFSIFCAVAGPRLSQLMGPSVGAPDRARYLQFIDHMARGGLLRFFRDHSVLARLCATTTENWIAFVVEFLERLSRDRPALERQFGGAAVSGPVSSVEVGLSDAHDGGKGVVICRFAGGARAVYKPRSIGLELFFADIVRWCNASGRLLPLRAVGVLSFPTHGWVEWVGPDACSDADQVRRFYRRCGALLAIVHAVHGGDFHRENLLASGEHPVLIDAESLLSHQFDLGPSPGTDPAPVNPAAMAESVLHTMMLPHLRLTADGQAIDMGALTVAAAGERPLVGTVWRDINTDAMRMEAGPVSGAKSRNHPVLAGRGVPALAYVEEVVAGFGEAYDLILERRDEWLRPGGLLAELGPQRVRFIFRNTSLYASLLGRTLHPSFLRDGAVHSMELDVLARPLLDAPERPATWPLLRAERRSLEQMDVPLFSARADGRHIELDDGEAVECFGSSAVDAVRRKMSRLDHRDKAVQEELIRASFAAVAANGLSAQCQAVERDPAGAAPGTVRKEAEALARAIVERCQFEGERPTWTIPTYMAAARRHNPVPASVLFDGGAGIALALAGTSALTERSDLASVAHAVLMQPCGPADARRLARGTVEPGLGTGVASIAYASLRASELLGEPALLAGACQSALLLDPDTLPAKGPVDLLAGRAGALLVLVRLFQATGDADWLARAQRFADDLLARRQKHRETGHRVWITHRGRCETGFAHGQSGIAYALTEVAACAGRSDLREAAREALAFERRVLGADLGGALKRDAHAAWSHGSAGIGLARAAMLRSGDEPEVRQDLEAAVANTRRSLHHGPDDLCSGVLGRIELLLAAADPLERPALRREAEEAAEQVMARALRDGRCRLGWQAGYQHPGLFQGLAGLLYSWARFVDPRRVRSVASFA